MMKKLLLTTAACGLVMSATAAHAQVELNLAGSFKGYGVWVDQDEATGKNVHNFDFIRNTEVHFTGETTLDNGLTVGFHIEAEADGNDGFNVDESYAYFSGAWGRVNFGDEDGASYLLQVAAPSADENIDGIRQFVNPVNYDSLLSKALVSNPTGVQQAAFDNFARVVTRSPTTTTFDNTAIIGSGNSGGIDYDADPTGKNTKLTYLSPILNGFQVGASYTPDQSRANESGVRFDNAVNSFGDGYEIAARYEGQFDMVGVTLGAGFAHIELERSLSKGTTTAVPNAAQRVSVGQATDDRQVWNVGADLDIGPFGIGLIYKQDDFGDITHAVATATEGARTGKDEKTWVVGVDYTTGPFKFGASYLHQDNTFGVRDLDTQRYSGGVTYTYGPGMTFRGSIGHVDHDMPANLRDVDATYVTLGTQINF
jgi:predicted porin